MGEKQMGQSGYGGVLRAWSSVDARSSPIRPTLVLYLSAGHVSVVDLG
jgi:hypothetical protein